MERYRIFNKRTMKWWEGLASSAEEALQNTNWNAEDCWIRVYTERGGWKNCTIKKIKGGSNA